MSRNHPPRSILLTNRAYDPDASRREWFIRCGVCGFPLDEEIVQTSEGFASQTLVTDPESGLLVTQISGAISCYFCGSGNWRNAAGPEGVGAF